MAGNRDCGSRALTNSTMSDATGIQHSLGTLKVTYVPLASSTFASNVGRRSTLTDFRGLELCDMLNCKENRVSFTEVNCHESPTLLLRHDLSLRLMAGSFSLNWEALSILFMTITQSRSELFFNAVPFATDPPYKDT